MIMLLALISFAHAEDFLMGPRRKVTLEVAPGWKAESKRKPGRGIEITVAPHGQANALCRITVLKSVGTQRYSPKGVDQAMKAVGKKMLTNVVETEVLLQKFELKNGYGVYSCYTDKKLVDKEPAKGDFKVATTGMVMFTDEFAANIAMFADSLDGEEFQAMLAMVTSMELRPAGTKAAAGSN